MADSSKAPRDSAARPRRGVSRLSFARGRDRIGYGTAAWHTDVELRLDETEIGTAKFVTLTEVQATSSEAGPVTAATLSDRLLLDCDQGYHLK
jgi:hypothetical protein